MTEKLEELEELEELESHRKLPNPEAVGFLKGRVVDYDGGYKAMFELDGGVKIPCTLLGGQVAAKKRVAAQTQVWTVYPTIFDGALNLKVRTRAGVANKSKEGQFFINGRIKGNSEDRILVEIWSVERQRDYYVVVEGYLLAEVGQYWQLEAALEGSKLVLVDGKMLSAVFNRDDFVSMRTVKEKAVSLVAEPEAAADDHASSLEPLREPVVG